MTAPLAARIGALSNRKLLRLVRAVGEQAVMLAPYSWDDNGRPAQLPPPGDWQIWLMMAGRGFGKTRAGAEWVRSVAETDGAARIALIGASLHEARSVMVEGVSGLLAVSPPGDRPAWSPSLRRLAWRSGAQAMLYGAGDPDTLRGPQHSHAWCDEIAKWPLGVTTWDNLMLTMRGGPPRVMATTTPRPVPLVRRLLAQAQAQGDVVVRRGRTVDNALHLPGAFIDAMLRTYGGTRLGRQELDGEMIDDVEGALWTRDLIERCRVRHVPVVGEEGEDKDGPVLRRVIVGVDPPAGVDGDACGIVVAGLGGDGIAYVVADASVSGRSPEGWARAVAGTAAAHGADRVVAEANNGGAMVASVLRAVDAGLPVRLVHASVGKSARAEPVAALYEAGRVAHRGLFAEMEDQMCGMTIGGGYEGPGRSPDRADALVWALSELMLGKRGMVPRVTGW